MKRKRKQPQKWKPEPPCPYDLNNSPGFAGQNWKPKPQATGEEGKQ